jgi:hypothetical protein
MVGVEGVVKETDPNKWSAATSKGQKCQADNLEAASLNPFELKRLENIAANQAVLKRHRLHG